MCTVPPESGDRVKAAVCRVGLALGLAAWLGAHGTPALAQTPSGRFVGQVVSLADGRPVSGARVQVGADVAITGPDGTYRLTVPPGRYGVRVTAPGFDGATVVDQIAGLAVPGEVALGADTDATRVDVALPELDADPEALRNMAESLQSLADVPSERTDDASLGALEAPAPTAPRTVRVWMPDGRILEMDMDEYLRGVVPSEMGYIARRAFEALRAQAIASRTYAAMACMRDSAGDPTRCEPGLDANVDTTTRSQVWRPVHYDLSDAAVVATHGQMARSGDGPIHALFFARARDRTLDSEASNCCGGRAWPYLRSAASPDPFGARWGHGAGMSQEGAAVLADWGATAEEIIAHYYVGAAATEQNAPRLTTPTVAPRSAAQGEPVAFRVVYTDGDADPPPIHEVVIGGDPRPMRLVDRSNAADYRAGTAWVYTSTLAAGSYAVRFRFGDGYLPAIEIAAGTLVVQPAALGADAEPAPQPEAPEPSPAGVLAGSAELDVAAFTADARSAEGIEAAAEGPIVLEGPIVEAAFPFMAVAAQWTGPEDPTTPIDLAVRVSRDGVGWSRWLPFADEDEDGRYAAPEGEHWSRLVIARGRFLQARIRQTSAVTETVALDDLVLHYLDADDGPRAPSPGAVASAAAFGLTADVAAAAIEDDVIRRAAWGADESQRFDAEGAEIWPPEYTEPRAQIVHHTVSTNDPVDPAAIVRSILHFHAVTRGWGDIGYNFLIDHRGNVYEGRFGGERPGRIVQGGHARQFNTNSIGVALLGTFTEADARPSTAAEHALIEFLAAKGVRYGVDPQAPVTLQGVSFAHRVMGHRDALSGLTACPGQGLYDRLDTIRAAVARRMGELAGPAPTARSTTTATRVPATATATPRPPARPTPTPVPIGAGCAELVPDGGFESRDPVGAGWKLNRALATSWDVYSGAGALFIGLQTTDPDVAQTYASAALRLQVPARIGSARLRFFARTVGQPEDRRLVRLMNDEGAVVALGNEALPANSEWRAYSFDVGDALASLAGRAVRVYFGVVNDGDGRRSYMRLDDVSLVACAELGPTTPPTPTARPTAAPTVAAVTTATPRPTPRPTPSETSPGYPPPRPTATAGPSPTPLPTPGPNACAGPIDDGGFEDSALGRWRALGDFAAIRVAAPAHSGQGALRLGPEGDEAAFGFAAAARAFPVSDAIISGTLSVWLRAERPLGGDTFVLEWRRVETGVRYGLVDGSALGPVGQWRNVVIPLDRAQLGDGGPSELYAALLHRGGEAPAAVLIDDVVLSLCRSGLARVHFPSASNPQ